LTDLEGDGWQEEGSQEHLRNNPRGSSDYEPELGWQNAYHGGSQLGIADECRDRACYESDGDADDEPRAFSQ
jgi:hypothetical protein